MKKAKKLVSLLLAVVMLLSLAVSVGASGETPAVNKEVKTVTVTLADSATTAGDAEDGTPYRGTINVNNALYKEDYSIWQILYLDSVSTYVEGGVTKTSYSYVVNPEWKNFVTNATDSTGQKYFKLEDDPSASIIHVTWDIPGITTGSESARTFARQALKYAKDNNITANATTNVAPADVTDETKSNYNYSVSFTNAGYGYYLLDSSVGALCSLTTAGNGVVNITEKNLIPTTDKKVFNTSGYESSNTANVGDIVYFKSEITVPYMTTGLYFNDKMDAGLEFYNPADDVVSSTDGQVIRHSKLTVTMMRNGGNTPDVLTEDFYELITSGAELGEYSFRIKFKDKFYQKMAETGTGGAATRSWTVVVYYSAKVTEAAVDVTDGVKNTANLSYGDKGTFTPDNITKTYTFKINIMKYTGDDTNPKALENAKFKIYQEFNATDAGKASTYKWYKFKAVPGTSDDQPAVYIYDGVAENEGAATEIITNKSGKFIIKGISHGTYRIKETTPPPGFNPLKDALSVEIRNDGTVNFMGDLQDDEFVMIKNNTGTELPATGGIGTTIFYVVGSILLVGAAILLIVKKRMNDEK